MKIKIKVRPEDFRVQEISSLPLKDRGGYVVYELRKKGWNTVDAAKLVSRELKLPLDALSYGGRKDRHAETFQWVTLKNLRGLAEDIRIHTDISLHRMGFAESAMGPDFIRANQFDLVVRSLEDSGIERAKAALQGIERVGYENYFDDQRFGPFDPEQGFFAEKILKGHYNGALKLFLTRADSNDPLEERERKTALFQNWKDWEKCFSLARGELEKICFGTLKEKSKAFLTVIKMIPREEILFQFISYQSFLWNGILRKMIREQENVLVYPGITSEYLFSQSLGSEFKNLEIPLPGSGVKLSGLTLRKLYEEVLSEQGLKPSSFNLRDIRNPYFKSHLRKAFVFPEKLHYEVEADELFPGKQKLSLHFVLPRGSFGTMLLKRVFAEKL